MLCQDDPSRMQLVRGGLCGCFLSDLSPMVIFSFLVAEKIIESTTIQNKGYLLVTQVH